MAMLWHNVVLVNCKLIKFGSKMIYFPVKGLKSPWGNRVKNAHLSKGPSDLNQNGAQDIKPF